VLDLPKAGEYQTLLADPPWRFRRRTGKGAPEHGRLFHYPTLTVEDICRLPVQEVVAQDSVAFVWVPNALLTDGLEVLSAWGFKYRGMLVWGKTTKAGLVDPRGLGWWFRQASEIVLVGSQGLGKLTEGARTQANLVLAPKTRHSEKPEEFYEVIERCSPGPYVELFARKHRPGWDAWGNEV